jgi:Spy/CpxP family protein refolding chaperone
MTDKPKLKLTDEQKQQLRAMIVASVREGIARRDELKHMAATQRAVFKALVEAPKWSIAMLEKPENMGPTDELWSMTPTMKKT